MALEQLFECPRTLRRLRSDPLGKLLEGFCNWLLEHGFSRWTIRKHLFNVSHLNEHLGGTRSRVCQGISSKEIEVFFKAYPLRCRNRGAPEEHLRRVGYSINRFLDYLRESGRLDSLPRPEIYQPLLDAYLQCGSGGQNAQFPPAPESRSECGPCHQRKSFDPHYLVGWRGRVPRDSKPLVCERCEHTTQ